MMHPYESGLVLFIRKKLENLVPLETIREMLLRAGFSQSKIDDAVKEVHQNFAEAHQDVVAANNFLPPLKGKNTLINQEKKDISTRPPSKSLFEGRIRRRDFILGFVFFFGIGITILSFALGILSFIYADFIKFTNAVLDDGLYGFWMLLVLVAIAPVTIMILTLLFRRLHDLSLPGALAFGFLVFFISPVNAVFSPYGIWVLQAVMALVFVLMLSKKGDSVENKYGKPPSIKGSIFARIFNID